MSNKKRRYNTLVSQAKQNVVGFTASYTKFIERVSIEQNSGIHIINYSIRKKLNLQGCRRFIQHRIKSHLPERSCV